MEEKPGPDPQPQLRVGLTYNLKKGLKSEAKDIEAEYDNIETVIAIKNALEGARCKVELMEADEELPERLKKTPVDIVFNIAEGSGGRGREAQVPALLSLMGIPFVGSDETTLCIALDKALAKRLLNTYGVKSPRGRVLSKQPNFKGAFNFPAIVKPNAEGSSKGISDVCIVYNKNELERLVNKNVELYRQDMLAEEFIEGREFTVGVLGNKDDTRVFPPMEIIYLSEDKKKRIYSFEVKQNYKELVRYECPPNLDKKTEAKIVKTSKKIYDALGCRDFARMDFRLSDKGELYFIEINPLPGLAPGYSDFPMLAEFSGVDYVSLVRAILKAALKRHGMVHAFDGDD